MKIQSFSLAIVAAVAALSLPALAGSGPVTPAATPPPTPPPVVVPAANTAATATASPGATDTPAATVEPSFSPEPLTSPDAKGRHGRGQSRPAAPVVARKGLEGVWEVQIQGGDTVTYAHFELKQLADELIGIYIDPDNKKYPVAGSLDDKQLRLVVSKPDGTTLLFEATVDGTTDMLGLLTDTKGSIPFTAAYRPKESWMDNLNTQPGGFGTPTSGTTTGGTGGTASGAGGIPPR